MDRKTLKYRKIIKEVLNAYAGDELKRTYQPDDMQIKLIIDTENDHYQVLYAGWQQEKQVFSIIFHFDIINSKIWVQRLNTDYDIIEDIENKGVPKSDIVLAYHSPQVRILSGYAQA